ncbi:MAG: hypothetical protein ACLPHP_05305 [Candidatus Sulfotelmatobacter sp.]
MTAVAFVGLLVSTIVPAKRHMEVHSMGCEKIDRPKLAEERMRLEQLPKYIPRDRGHANVQFDFNLDSSETDESLFVIVSGRLGKAIYRGAYQDRISVDIDSKLSEDHSYDSLEFHLLQFKNQQVCRWINERGEPYWRAGAHITIRFLQEPTVDKDGLPKRFDVEIR